MISSCFFLYYSSRFRYSSLSLVRASVVNVILVPLELRNLKSSATLTLSTLFFDTSRTTPWIWLWLIWTLSWRYSSTCYISLSLFFWFSTFKSLIDWSSFWTSGFTWYSLSFPYMTILFSIMVSILWRDYKLSCSLFTMVFPVASEISSLMKV